MANFSTRTINKLKPGMHCYEPGVYLRVRNDGTRSWCLKYSLDGRRRELGLGPATQAVAAVIAKANRAKGLIAEGKDPVDERHERRAERRHVVVKAPTMKAFVPEAVSTLSRIRGFSRNTSRNWDRTSCIIVRELGEIRVDELTTNDVIAFLRPVWDSRTGHDLFLHLRVIMGQAIAKGLRQDNPAEWAKLSNELPSRAVLSKGKEESHYDAVSADELRAVAQRLWAKGTQSSLCALFGILTVGRAKEFSTAEWDEIDLKENTFSVPPCRRKDRKPVPHVVPLSRQALTVLCKADTSGTLVFPGRTGRGYSYNTIADALRSVTDQPITTHGTRSTFSDWCVRNDKSVIVSEKCLMHSVGSKVFRAYQRDDLLDKRRVLLQEWADFLLPEL